MKIILDDLKPPLLSIGATDHHPLTVVILEPVGDLASWSSCPLVVGELRQLHP